MVCGFICGFVVVCLRGMCLFLVLVCGIGLWFIYGLFVFVVLVCGFVCGLFVLVVLVCGFICDNLCSEVPSRAVSVELLKLLLSWTFQIVGIWILEILDF